MVGHALPAERALRLDWLDGLCRHRGKVFAAIAAIYLLCFNGLWRIGLDSALYRGIGHALATGRGYTFGGVPHDHVYAGLPYLLAGIEKLFGPGEFAPVLAMNAITLATLVVVYKLMLTRFPMWLALIVTIGTACNGRFIGYAQSIQSDIPFLFGLCLSLLGWERLARADTLGRRARAGAILTIGLLIAASMRPTFWVLAVAWTIACVIGLIRSYRLGGASGNPRFWFHLSALGLLAAVALIAIGMDPRTQGFNPTGGEYEQEFLIQLGEAQDNIVSGFLQVFGSNLNEAFFGESMSPVEIPLAIVLIVGAGLVTRRLPVWGLPVFVLIAVTLVMSNPPRYFVMVLPVLWLGWVLLMSRLTMRCHPMLRGPVFAIALLLVLLTNIGDIASLMIEQRAADRGAFRGEDRRLAFLAEYKDGAYLPILRLANLIQDNVPEGQTVVGPVGNVITCLSGRRVIGDRTMLVYRPVEKWPAILRDTDADWWVFPSTLYRSKDDSIYRLMRRGLVRPREVLAQDGELYIAKASIFVPEDDWRDLENDAIESRKAAADRKAAKRRKAKQQRDKKRKSHASGGVSIVEPLTSSAQEALDRLQSAPVALAWPDSGRISRGPSN